MGVKYYLKSPSFLLTLYKFCHCGTYHYENMTLKITLKNHSNTENLENKGYEQLWKFLCQFQWDYKDSTFLINKSWQISVWLRENVTVIIFCRAFQCGFRGVWVWLDFSVWFSVSYFHRDIVFIYFWSVRFSRVSLPTYLRDARSNV